MSLAARRSSRDLSGFSATTVSVLAMLVCEGRGRAEVSRRTARVGWHGVGCGFLFGNGEQKQTYNLLVDVTDVPGSGGNGTLAPLFFY